MMKKITLLLVMLFFSLLGFSQPALTEDFEGTSLPAAGNWALTSGNWKVFDNGIGTAQSWGVLPAPNSCNGRSAYLSKENVTDGTFAEDWLVTPQVTIPTNGQLHFSTKQTLAANFGSIYTIRVSTTSQTNAGSFTTIQTWNETELNAIYNVCEEKVVQFPATYIGQQVYVAFVMTNDDGDRWIVDDVSIVEQCLDPTVQTATNATLTGATLGWDNPSGASQWEVEIVGTGATPTGTGTIVNTNPYSVTGLTEGTCYDFYVRAKCTSGSNSQWVGPFNFCTVSLGETCGAPITIPSLPYCTTDNTSGYGDDYSGSPGASGCGTTGTYLNGDDVIYQFTATSTNSVTITSQTTSTWSGLFVYNSCANIGVSCVAGNTAGNGSTTPDTLTFTPTVGQTYYIVISTWAAPQNVPYTLCIVENSCVNMTSNFEVVSNCASGTDTFFVTANVTNMGSATSISGTTTPASTTETLTAAGTMQFGPFPNNTPVTINLQNDQDVNCFRNSNSLTQTFCPAPNNLCADAIALSCNSTVAGTTQGSSSVGAPTSFCGTASNTSPGVWYTFAGNGDVVTFSLCGSPFDTRMQVLTGSCGTFTCVAGNDNSCGLQSEIQLATTSGTLYYIYVYGVNNTTSGTFTLNTTCVTPPNPPTNDNCDAATTVAVNTDGSCTQLAAGTVAGATPSSQANSCVGSADDDVWYSFTATQATHIVTIQDIVGSTIDLNHAIYTSTNATNPCGSLTQIICSNPNLSVANTFVAGQVYFIRVYTATAALLQTTTFNVCVSVPPPPPANDSCATPTLAPVNTSLICTNTVAGTISSATASPEPFTCTGSPDDDVWFQFTALASIHNINLNNIQGTTTDLAFAVYSGPSCGALTQINCQVNNNGLVGGLTAGDVYYIRVYSQPATTNLLANFDLCITTPTQCDSAQTTCGDGSIINNQIGLPSYGNIGCLFTTPNPFWFTIEIETSGPITFTLNQTSAGNSDVDFILWGPFTDAQINTTACNNLYDYPDGNTTIPNNIIDCSYSAASTEFIDIPNAIVGQHYLLLVTNYGNSIGTFNLNQTSGSGAAACCTVDLGQDVTLCNQTSHTITATFNSEDSIKWFKDNVLIPGQTTETLTVTESGTYKCEITCGQLTKDDEVVITFNTAVADQKADLSACDSYTLPNDLSVNNSYYTETGGPAGTGVMLNPGDVITTTQTIYIFAESGTTPNCTDESSFDVTVTSAPVLAPVSDVVACDSYVLPALTVGNYFSQTGGVSPIDISVALTSTQTVYVYAESGTAPSICSAEDSFTVTINTIDADSPADVFACDSYILPTLSANNFYYTQPGGPTGTGVLLNAGDVITTTQVIYIYAQTNTTPNCTDEASFTLTITATPAVSTVGSDSVCEGSVYTFPAIASGSYYTGSDGTGTQYAAGDTVTITATQTFYVYASNGTAPNNCSAQTSFTITAVDAPIVSLSGGCVSNVYTINASLSSGASATYVWTGPSGTLNQTGPSITVSQDGEYTCVATTTLPNGSSCASQAVVFAANGTLCQIQKGISPNNDGLNDNFDLTGLNARKLEIFNRYGTKVYSFSNYTDQWYGQSDNGNELPSGTYYFVIERDNAEAKSGWIYINR